MSIFESIERHPVQYLPTGDRALLVAWVVASVPAIPQQDPEPLAILCLEDGTAVRAGIGEFKFDYRYSNADQKWYDVSRITEGDDNSGNADQGSPDDGSAGLPGLLPDPDGAGEGDPVNEP